MKKVLLTGGAGSIGIHVLSHIMHNTDWEVVILDSFRHKGFKDRITELCKDHPEWYKRFREIQHDLICPINPEMEKEIGHIDYILHLAALSDVFFSVENPVYTIKNNVDSTLMMLEYARKIKPQMFIYFSTDEVYGPVGKSWQECTDENCYDSPSNHKHEKLNAHKEWDTHRPSNAYSASKAACEDICYSYWRSYDVPIVITNTMNNFAEMQSASKFPVIVQKKLEHGEKVIIHGNDKEIGTRYYIHSRNSADALLHIIKKGVRHHVLGEIDEPYRYHIVGDECLSNLELAQRIANLMDKELIYELQDFHSDNPAHDIHYGLQNNNLKDWKQPMSFDESMKKTIEWQQEHREWIE